MTQELKEEVTQKRRLAYIPERNGITGIANEEFYELAQNYISHIKLPQELMEDLSRIFCYILMKSYYNVRADSIHALAPFLRYLFDPNHSIEATMKMARAGYIYRDMMELLNQLIPFMTSPMMIRRMLDILDVARKEEYKSKIASDRDINWLNKGDAKKGN